MAKKYSLYSPTASIQRRLFRRGRSNRGFAALAGVFLLLRVIQKATSRRPEIAAVDRLKPGQALTILAIAPPTRRQRKAARRAVASD